ncbi:hypothetical protein QC760_010558 [Botrytis cinerea]
MQTPLTREWLLSGHSRLREFVGEIILAGLNCLRADNFCMRIASQTFPGGWDSIEKRCGTEYKYEKIPADFLEEIKTAATSKKGDRLPELHLPHANPFIPTNFVVEKKEAQTPAISPKLIRNDDSVRLWFKKDDTFLLPKANVFIVCRNPLPTATAENSLKVKMYTDLVYDALEDYAYYAELAGLEYSVSSHSMGLEINVSGYNNKLPVLLEMILIAMKNLVVKQDRFEIIKERITRSAEYWNFHQPHYQVEYYMSWLSSEKGYINEQYLLELPHVTADDIQQFYSHLLRQMHMETFVHGNLYRENALKLAGLTESIFKPRVLPQTQWPIGRSLVFPPGANCVYRKTWKDPVSVNHCIKYVLSIGDKAVYLQRAKTLLLNQMIHEPAFDQLQTKEQLGYTLFNDISTEIGIVAYAITIQSEKTPQYLEERIDFFLIEYLETLKEMSDSEFEGHKKSSIAHRLGKLKNLDEESNRLWSYIESEEFDFELVHHDATHIEALTKEDMIQFYNQFILPSSPLRSKLSIHLIAQGTSFPEGNPDEQTISMNNEDHKNAEDGVAIVVNAKSNGTIPYVITDVRQFKSMLQTTAGPQPVKHISEFEEL